MRARYPDDDGVVERDGVRIGYEWYEPSGPDVRGDESTILLPTSVQLATAEQWKLQIPFLSRYFRVLVVEMRGNGRSDIPSGPAAYRMAEIVADAVVVLDHLGVSTAVAVGLSGGGRVVLELAAAHPERIAGVVAFAPLVMPRKPDVPEIFEPDGRFRPDFVTADFCRFAEFFASMVYTDPHSTKIREDLARWSAGTTAQAMIDSQRAFLPHDAAAAWELCRRVRCPVLVVHGDEDPVIPLESAAAVAEWTGGELVMMPGSGHVPNLRDPVRSNLLMREFTRTVGGTPRERRPWTPARRRARRALFLSSPIGLGHVRRDLAIADELRALHPDLEIDWLAQHPVSHVLAERGERVHPASRWLASESGHVESEAAEHDLHAFQALRTMEEILLANFHVLAELAETEHHDLWVGDEAWDLDHHLHENPELKRCAYAWLTDFVGFLPVEGDDDRRVAVTADYNAQMIEQVQRYPRLRDRALFVGDPEDVVPDAFGPGLPAIRDWTRDHYAFPGYVTGFTPIDPRDRAGIRAELGWRPDERVCLVTAGGTGIGLPLLRRVSAGLAAARREVERLRMIVVTGPRIDPDTVPAADGLEVTGWVPDLYRRLAACDLAITHGGLTTTMELTANRRPFLYVPLRRHFEQSRHVPHRLARYRSGRRMDWDELEPERLAAAIRAELDAPADPRPVDPGGAARCAALLAELL